MSGPTFHARFSDGVETRMSVFTSLTRLDVTRAVVLARHAYRSRVKYQKEPPQIEAAHFELEGKVVKKYSAKELLEAAR